MIIRQTHSEFDEFKFSMLFLSRIELAIVARIAGTYSSDENMLAVRVYEQMYELHKRMFIDEVEGDKTLGMIYNNYSSKLGLSKKYEKTLEIISEGIKHEITTKSLNPSHSLIYNIGYTKMYQNKSPEEVIPYFALSYFVANSLAPYHNRCKICAGNAKSKLKEKFGIDIDCN